MTTKPNLNIERVRRNRDALDQAKLDAFIVALPSNVLLLSGYWPVIGTSLAISTRSGETWLIVPEDERSLAEEGWADKILTFKPVNLQQITPLVDTVQALLQEAILLLHLESSRLGLEMEPAAEPVTYAGMYNYGSALEKCIRRFSPTLSIGPADALLASLRAMLTPSEVAKIRIACRIAETAFRQGARLIQPGMSEVEVAMLFRSPLIMGDPELRTEERLGGFMYCMSGPNGAQASAAFQRTRDRKLQTGDLALVHCNSHVGGYWTDITRTYCLGEPDDRQRRMYEAVQAAHAAAMKVVRPGARAADVDQAARHELTTRGFGAEFTTPSGHGVGFAAINHNAKPIIHPVSTDILQEGMVFNLEPAIYIDGYAGLRHCNMVMVTPDGAQVLTTFQSAIDELTIL